MEKSLGKIIKKRRIKPPFETMGPEQKVPFSSIVSKKQDETSGGISKNLICGLHHHGF